jgi:hypothetical protein
MVKNEGSGCVIARLRWRSARRDKGDAEHVVVAGRRWPWRWCGRAGGARVATVISAVGKGEGFLPCGGLVQERRRPRGSIAPRLGFQGVLDGR